MPEKCEWKTPELIVLERNRPEEAVLASCKLNTGAGSQILDYDICRIWVQDYPTNNGKFCVECKCSEPSTS